MGTNICYKFTFKSCGTVSWILPGNFKSSRFYDVPLYFGATHHMAQLFSTYELISGQSKTFHTQPYVRDNLSS